MTKRLQAAAETALEILSVDGNGEGWNTNDAITALRLGLGLDVDDESRDRMVYIAPELLEDEKLVVGEHTDIVWVMGARGPSPWRCQTCGKRGSGTIGDEPIDYVCLEEEADGQGA